MNRFLIAAMSLIVVGAGATALTPFGTAEAQTAPKASFGCDARAPNICNFRIHYERGSREVVLPAGMKAKIPAVRIGTDTYCVTVNRKPVPSCARKVINAKYNS